jgi:hypothetical protein
MEEKREIQKGTLIWRSRSFCVIAVGVSLWALGLWVLGAIGQTQTTACQVGVYECLGQLYLSNGNVGIGTSAPGANLDVGVGATQCCASQVPNISLAQASSTNNQMSWLQFHNAGESEAYIRLAGAGPAGSPRAGQRRLEIGDTQGALAGLTVTGNVGIGTTNPIEKLQVAGNLAISGTMTAGIVPLARMAAITTLTFTNIPSFGGADLDFTHNLGTDSVMFILMSNSPSILHSATAMRPDGFFTGIAHGMTPGSAPFPPPPAGVVRVRFANTSSSTATVSIRLAVLREN